MAFVNQNTQSSLSYYDILSVTPQASDDEIKQAYRKLAMRFHPDRNPNNRSYSEQRFRVINEAYSSLKTKEKRAQYNRVLRSAHNDNSGWFSHIAGIFSSGKSAG